MPTIHVDFDVFKAITARRPSEEVTENDVLRQLFGLGSAQHTSTGAAPNPKPGDWVTKGVRFPQGTQARATYKGQLYLGEVRDGALRVAGTPYESPSAAAMSITKSQVNGWGFWEVKLPHQGDWQPMREYRDQTREESSGT